MRSVISWSSKPRGIRLERDAVVERLHAKEEKSKQGLLGFTREPFGLGKSVFTKS